ncbi:MAG: hypothetical protein R3249_05530, partial [Nitriliruptorales bacterium]|nr:hypothetical protein [Nitriliruptorales bacterium]
MQTVDVIGWVTNITFVVAGLAAFRIWWKQRESPPARWLLLTFAVIDAIILSTIGLSEDAELPRLVTAVLLAGIVVFPWCLFRFADALTGTRRRQVILVSGLTAVVVLWGFVLPEFPEEGEPLTGIFIPYVIALIGSWA